MTKIEIEQEVKALSMCEVAIETNEGTYGSADAMRAIRTGDPAFANYTTYERVGDGSQRTVGCDPKRAPGRARNLGRDDLAAKRSRLAELKQLIHSAK